MRAGGLVVGVSGQIVVAVGGNAVVLLAGARTCVTRSTPSTSEAACLISSTTPAALPPSDRGHRVRGPAARERARAPHRIVGFRVERFLRLPPLVFDELLLEGPVGPNEGGPPRSVPPVRDAVGVSAPVQAAVHGGELAFPASLDHGPLPFPPSVRDPEEVAPLGLRVRRGPGAARGVWRSGLLLPARPDRGEGEV